MPAVPVSNRVRRDGSPSFRNDASHASAISISNQMRPRSSVIHQSYLELVSFAALGFAAAVAAVMIFELSGDYPIVLPLLLATVIYPLLFRGAWAVNQCTTQNFVVADWAGTSRLRDDE
jgi:hypothetical protein